MAAEAREQGHVPPPASKKKQKLRNGAAAVLGGMEVAATAELSGHTDAATAAAWSRDGSVYSGSMDHSVRPDNTNYYNVLLAGQLRAWDFS